MDERIEHQISAVLSRLDSLATDDRIVASANILWSADPASWEAFGEAQAFAGAYAWAKVGAYFTELRDIEAKRQRLSIEIREALHHLDDRTWVANHLDAAAHLKANSWFLGGQQEVLCHLFTICATKLHKYLQAATLPARTRVPRPDLDFLYTFTAARDHFEHPEQRLPGKNRDQALVVRTDTSFVVGLRSDSQGRLLIDGTPVEVSTRGFQRIERIVVRASDDIDRSCTDSVRAFLGANPERTPAPDSIGGHMSWTLDRPRSDQEPENSAPPPFDQMKEPPA